MGVEQARGVIPKGLVKAPVLLPRKLDTLAILMEVVVKLPSVRDILVVPGRRPMVPITRLLAVLLTSVVAHSGLRLGRCRTLEGQIPLLSAKATMLFRILRS